MSAPAEVVPTQARAPPLPGRAAHQFWGWRLLPLGKLPRNFGGLPIGDMPAWVPSE